MLYTCLVMVILVNETLVLPAGPGSLGPLILPTHNIYILHVMWEGQTDSAYCISVWYYTAIIANLKTKVMILKFKAEKSMGFP